MDRLDSWSLVITPAGQRSGQATSGIASALRKLPLPVIGRVKDGAVWLDLRTLEHEAEFQQQLTHLALPSLA